MYIMTIRLILRGRKIDFRR